MLTKGMHRIAILPKWRIFSSKAHEFRFKSEPPFKASVYSELSKAKLASFVLLTTMAGYALGPCPGSLSTLLTVTTGTGLCVMSANTLNQWIEAPFDAQMARTRNRPLVRFAVSPVHAFSVGIGAAVLGTGILSTINPYCAVLGFSNILLYSGAYTMLKRISIYNTWVGAIVGAIPPVIGWAANTGGLEPGAFILAAALYAWQFPHFNALSWNLRADYARAGYRMMSVLDSALNARVALRYALAMFPISYGCYFFGISSIYFVATSGLVNGYMAVCAYRFWKNSNGKSARKLFFSTLVHLPVFLGLLIFHKKQEEFKYPVNDFIDK